MAVKLHDDLYDILNRILDRYVDTEKKLSMNEIAQLNSDDMKHVMDVDIGFGARRQLKTVKEEGVSQT